LRVPGFGTRTVERILSTRRASAIRLADLARLHVARNKALPFIVLRDHRPSSMALDSAGLRARLQQRPQQLGFGF
jgi:predicted DNA-binding helix-hairpin-helix protein